jgi:hypothetical protein
MKHKDWDVSNGTKPDEVGPAECLHLPSAAVHMVWVVPQTAPRTLQLDILLYGGDGGGDLRPEFVPQNKWFIAAEFHPNANASVGSLAVCLSNAHSQPVVGHEYIRQHCPDTFCHLLGQVDYIPADVLWQCTNQHKEVPKPDPGGRFLVLTTTETRI